MVMARLISAIMRSSHSVPGVKKAPMDTGALGGATVRVGNCAPTPTPMANAIPITKVHCLTNIQPQTKDHSMKEWSGVDQFTYRTPLPLGQALLYSNGIPTGVGTLEVVVCGWSNPFALIMSLCNYLHTHILHHFPQKSRAVFRGGDENLFFTNAQFRCWETVMRCIRRPSGGFLLIFCAFYDIIRTFCGRHFVVFFYYPHTRVFFMGENYANTKIFTRTDIVARIWR